MPAEPNPPLHFFNTTFESSAPVHGPYEPAAVRSNSSGFFGSSGYGNSGNNSQWSDKWRSRVNDRNWLCKASCCTCFVIFVIVIIILAATHDWTKNSYSVTINAYCLYPTGGGGAVDSNGGALPATKSSACMDQLADYFDGGYRNNYYNDIKRVADNARDYFNGLGAGAASRNKVVVFDIDETVLSSKAYFNLPNIGYHSRYWDTWGGYPNRRLLMSDAESEELPLDFAGWEEAGMSTSTGRSLNFFRGDPPSDLPALEDMKSLYTWLYQQGYSVAFVTGRQEKSRQVTEANLLDAGFGKTCPAQGGSPTAGDIPPSAPGSPAPDNSPPPASEEESGSPAPYEYPPAYEAPPPEGRRRMEEDSNTPCYVELILRADGDTRPPSVTKPELRNELKLMGLEIVALFGDQFSDLSGENGAPAVFKLPNPMYFLL